MEKFILKTSFDCLIKSSSEEMLLSPNETLELEYAEKLNVYPLGSHACAFVVDLNKLEKSSFYDYTEIDDSTLICLQNGIKCETFKVATLISGDNKCTFEVSKSTLVVQSGNWKRVIELQEEFENFTTLLKEDIALIKLDNNRGASIYAFNIKSGEVKTFNGESAKFNDNGFELENGGLCTKYVIDSQGLKCENDNITSVAACNETIAYNFLSFLKNGATAKALSMCDNKLKANLDASTLKQFFGKVSYIYPLSAYTYAIKNESGLKYYRFTVFNQKIVDIECP